MAADDADGVIPVAPQSDQPLYLDRDTEPPTPQGAGEAPAAAPSLRLPRTALDDPIVSGLFIAATSVRDICRAMKVAQRLVAIAPDNPFAHLALSLVYLRAGQLPESLKAFDRAAQLASSFPRYLSLRAHWLCLLGKKHHAHRVVRDLKRIAPTRWETHRALAHWVLVSSPDQTKALHHLINLAQRHPEDPIVHALLAQVFCLRQDFQKVDFHLRQMVLCLPPSFFNGDLDAFVAHALAKQALATRFRWMLPLWWWERVWLRFPPRRYFLAITLFWSSVAIVLAGLYALYPSVATALITGFALLWCLYTRFADTIFLWWWRNPKGFGGEEG